MNAGLGEFEVISCWKDGYGKEVSISRSHNNKRVSECPIAGVAKLNFGVAKHRATMSSQSKWGRQLKKFKKP